MTILSLNGFHGDMSAAIFLIAHWLQRSVFMASGTGRVFSAQAILPDGGRDPLVSQSPALTAEISGCRNSQKGVDGDLPAARSMRTS